jgi:hypothetical protein
VLEVRRGLSIREVFCLSLSALHFFAIPSQRHIGSHSPT